MEHAFLEYKSSYLLCTACVWGSYRLVLWVWKEGQPYLDNRIEALRSQIRSDEDYWTSNYWPLLPYIEAMAYDIIVWLLDFLVHWSIRFFFVLEELHDWLGPLLLWLADTRFFRAASLFPDAFFLLDEDEEEEEEEEDEDTDEDQG